MKVLLLDTDSLQPQIVETEGGLEEWYRLIKCSLIDIVSREIGGRYYDVIVDDEGLYRGGGESNSPRYRAAAAFSRQPCYMQP